MFRSPDGPGTIGRSRGKGLSLRVNMVYSNMVSSIPLRRIFTQQTMTTVFALLALGFGLVLSLNQGNLIIIGFMALFTGIVALVFLNQVQTSIREAQYT